MAVSKYNKRARWASTDPIMQAGEIGIESDTKYEKIGNGKDPWSKLEYFGSPGYWAEFADASQQTTTANTPTEVTFRNSDPIANHGVRLDSDSKLVVEYPGIYVFEFVMHLENSDSQIHDVHFWLRKNNSGSAGDVDLTTLGISVVESHGGIPGRMIAVLDHTLNLIAEDYLELMWAPSDAAVSIQSESAITSPYTRPAAPSAVCNVFQVSAA